MRSPHQQIEVAAFLEALEPAVRDAYAAHPGLDAALAQLVEAARRGDPRLDVARFLRDVAVRVELEPSPERALGAVRADDLALATACGRGDPAALARFEVTLASEVAHAHARYRNAPISVDELQQAIRDRLLVAEPGATPRISSYQGRGALRAWVRMVAVRHLVDVVRAEEARADRPARTGGDDALVDLATTGDDPELAFLKRQYRMEFRAAFGRALHALEPRDRNILRHRYLEGLEVAELATIYAVHRGSMSRILGRIRDELLAGIRRELVRQLGVGADELGSIMALIGSRLELSLSGLLRASVEGNAPSTSEP